MSGRYARQRRTATGVIPRLGCGLAATGRWALGHPQPVLVAAIAGLAAWTLWGYVQHADAFRIEHVSLPPRASFRLPGSIIGGNLWALDVRGLAGELKRQEPWLKEVRVLRQMPDTVRIDAIPRVPVAQVRLDPPAPPAGGAQAGRWYPVDREGFLLPEGRAEAAEALVALSGFDHTDGLRAGKDNDGERLRLALRVLASLRRDAPAIARRVTELNVADPHQLRFTLEGKTDVRCGSEAELDADLARLRAALKALARQSLDARYIDVRFQEPVIGPRT